VNQKKPGPAVWIEDQQFCYIDELIDIRNGALIRSGKVDRGKDRGKPARGREAVLEGPVRNWPAWLRTSSAADMWVIAEALTSRNYFTTY
jgi:hypothetical protein